MVKELETELMERLRKARQEGQPWHVIAGLLHDHFATMPPKQVRRIVYESAASATELAVVMLQRYVKVFEKLQPIALESGYPVSDLVSSSFSAVEKAIRLYERDILAGLEALAGLRARKLTIESLREKLDATQKGSGYPNVIRRQMALSRRGSVIDRCEDALRAEARRLFGSGTTVKRRPSLRYFRPVGYDMSAADGRILGGCDLYFGPIANEDPIADLARSLLLARYLSVFYIVLAPDAGAPVLNDVRNALEVLDMPHVGLITVDEDGRANTERNASPSTEVSSGYAEICLALAGGRGLLPD